jgi:GTP-binding protein
MEISHAVFRCAALRASDMPREHLPQIAVAGRSNCGKSSLINWMLRQTVARVAKDPGRTRALNFFLVNRGFYLVDLPGYGYAKVSQQMRAEWGRELRQYLVDEERLAGVMCLVDIRRGLTPLDVELQGFLAEAGRERMVMLTKADKVGRGSRNEVQRQVQAQLGLPRPPLALSVRTGEGRKELLAELQDLLTVWIQKQRSD